MKSFYRKCATVLMAFVMLLSLSVTAAAAETKSQTSETLKLDYPVTTYGIVPDIMGTLSGTPTKGSFTLPRSYNEVHIYFVTDSSDVETYDINIKGPNNFNKTISVIGDGTSRSYTVGKMTAGTYSYTITRTHGSGNDFFVMLINDPTVG